MSGPRRASTRPTQREIARQLGISVMTVSNAYNRPDQLSQELRERILAMARELGYPGPDALARGLRRGHAGALGVLYDTWPSFVFQDAAATSFLEGLSRAIERAFLGLLLVPAPWPDHSPQATLLDTAMVDGFIVYSVADTDPQVPAAVARRPTVVVDQPRLDGVPFVGIDDAAAAESIARHVLGLGHRRIAVISFALARDGTEGRADAARQASATYAVTRGRLLGYKRALSEAGVAWDDIVVYECPGSGPRLGHRAASELLAGTPRPTALLATSDALATGALAAARELGIGVPAELTVTGFDDTAGAESLDPPLTTIRQPHKAKGERAGQLILRLLENHAIPPLALLPGELIIRGSTAPPPAATR